MRGREGEKETVGKLKVRLTKNFILRRRSLDFLHRAKKKFSQCPEPVRCVSGFIYSQN